MRTGAKVMTSSMMLSRVVDEWNNDWCRFEYEFPHLSSRKILGSRGGRQIKCVGGEMDSSHPPSLGKNFPWGHTIPFGSIAHFLKRLP